ncbi:hypothetical protein B0A49_06626 [Cryomyces minteri]|uniref:Uncharacterized protein n=1 Tax=Cryomyces minteri TaxID=331657 RepID=A0A4U0X1M2_9PEZI|nr:hypothetical protein B0A49_06626 [Cryomyces minteri]
MEGKRGGSGFAPLADAKRANGSTKGSDSDGAEDGPDGYRYKPDGLMKQSFSITTSTGQHLHLISYYARSHPTAQTLKQPSNDPQLRHIRPEKGMYPESSIHEQSSLPAVTRAPMVSPQFAASPHQQMHMASPYNRGSPAHPPPYGPPPGTYWAPPSPMNTPPSHQYHPGPYYANGHPPPGALGQSPLQHVQQAYPGQSHQYVPSLTAFDRPPAPLSNSNLPPPPPQPHQMPPMQNGHAYHYPGAGPASQYRPHAASHTAQGPDFRQQQRPSNNSYGMMIDPRLSAMQPPSVDERNRLNPVTAPQQPAEASKIERRPSPPPIQLPSAVSSNPSAQTIPSISSLINGANQTAENQKEDAIQRCSSKSPRSSQRVAQDVSSNKLGYGPPVNDDKMVRQIDKVTFRN